MRLAVLIQARMTSTRLPGKVLTRIGDRPLIQYVVERAQRSARVDDVIVATSTEADDDPIAAWCGDVNVPCFRGSLNHVARRFLGACEAHGLDAFARICADSPLIDSSLVSHAIALFRTHDRDLVTNVSPRTFPPGQSIEVVRTATLRSVVDDMDLPQREHVTRYFYDHAARFRILNIPSRRSYGDLRFTIDTPEDLARMSRLIATFDRPHWELGLPQLAGALLAQSRWPDGRSPEPPGHRSHHQPDTMPARDPR